MATEVGGDEAVVSTPRRPIKRCFLDLPAETQQEIISHCSQSDLICVALVSRRFHELASSQLYRNFHIVFPDDDDMNFDSPIDGLAGGLDTFTTSDYNYAKHLKDLSMDTLSAGLKGEHSYQSYLYSASCGKFLNTLLYLTLKKANALEVFRWNIRVELSRPVFRELHRIASLTRLHVRMQAGSSYYTVPPPLPTSIETGGNGIPGHWSLHLPQPPPPGSLPPPPLPPPAVLPQPPPPAAPPSTLLPQSRSAKNRGFKRDLGRSEPPTFSGFKNLRDLSVLDIDTVEVIAEVKACIKNSFSTLKELQLSLSDSLAQQSRKPPPDSDADDSDVDDDFQSGPASPSHHASSRPAKIFRAQEERRVQDSLLAKIFDVEQKLSKNSSTQTRAQQSNIGDAIRKEIEAGDPHEGFISSLKQASAKLMTLQNGSKNFSISQQDVLDIIEKAARKYVDSCDDQSRRAQEGPSASQNGESGASGSASKDAFLASSGKTTTALPTVDPVASSGDQSLHNGVDQQLMQRAPSAITPDDIDITHVEMIGDSSEDVEEPWQVETNKETNKGSEPIPFTTEGSRGVHEDSGNLVGGEISEPQHGSTTTAIGATGKLWDRLDRLQAQFGQVATRVEKFRLEAALDEYHKTDLFDAELTLLNKSVGEMVNEIRAIEVEALDLTTSAGHGQDQSQISRQETIRRSMDAYARDTRGLSLESLSIHLFPVKASVLARAIDLTCLKQLTLLNVGNQTAVWTLLAKEGRTKPLSLRSVFTDHVSTAFLSCMAQLPELHDLLMLERSTKYKPESFASRTTTTIDQIRRLVLRRHMPTLRRLVINDESDGPKWDINEKTMILICTRGTLLEELALSMNIHAVHAFMQYFSGLFNLRAINILHFKNNDTCMWVMREVLRFMVDNLSHHPELKLEWIAMEDERVDRVIRPSESTGNVHETPPTKRAKGKAKDNTHSLAGMSTDTMYPQFPLDGLESESDSDDEVSDSGTRLRFKTVGPLQFYDAWGVKIFEKEVRTGRL